MKKIFNLSIALIFTLTFFTFTSAQDTTSMPETKPKEVPIKRPTSETKLPPAKAIIPKEQEDYDVPIIKVSELKSDKTELSLELEGLKGKAYLKPNKDGATQIEMMFDDLKDVPKDKLFHLWMVSSEGKYTKIGKVVNTGKDSKAEVSGGTSLKDFGLFITVEESEVETPKGKTYAAFKQESDE